MERQCFELIDEHHCKFWTVELVNQHYLATFGRIGTQGQTQVKTFGSPGAAKLKVRDMIIEKTMKGYTEVAADKHPGAKKALIDLLMGAAAKVEEVKPVPMRQSSLFTDGRRAISLKEES